jgi:predicted metal-binding membrane protein
MPIRADICVVLRLVSEGVAKERRAPLIELSTFGATGPATSRRERLIAGALLARAGAAQRSSQKRRYLKDCAQPETAIAQPDGGEADRRQVGHLMAATARHLFRRLRPAMV